MTDYDKQSQKTQMRVRHELQKEARSVYGQIVAEYGMNFMHNDGQTKFLDYKFMKNIGDSWERRLIKAINMINDPSWSPKSSVAFNQEVTTNRTSNSLSSYLSDGNSQNSSSVQRRQDGRRHKKRWTNNRRRK